MWCHRDVIIIASITIIAVTKRRTVQVRADTSSTRAYTRYEGLVKFRTAEIHACSRSWYAVPVNGRASTAVG